MAGIKQTTGRGPDGKGGKPAKLSEFVFTIEDDDENVPDLDQDESEEEKELKLLVKKSKNNNNRNAEENEQEMDPSFEFTLEGYETTGFDGWDFAVEEKFDKKDVELDEIIRRKGGLKEEDDERDEKDNEERNDKLPLDGFGMGAEDEDEDNEDNEDEESDENEDSNVEMENASDSESGHPADTSEEIAQFYAPQEEADSAKKTVHKTFQTLSLSRPVLRGIASLAYHAPTPIQGAVIPIALLGKDVVAGAVTGSGKTAAYLIPILERLLYRPTKIPATRVVVLTPTRELAIQVLDVGKKLGLFVSGLRFGLAVGGLNLRTQEQELKTRPDVVIATPGRFIDHVRNSPSFQVDTVEILVIDEADRMLEEGFQKELTEILSLIPSKRQTLLFSATMNSSIKDLIQLSLHKPVRIMIGPPKQAAGGLVQEFIRIRKREPLRPAVLHFLLKKIDRQQRVIVFVSRKETAHKLRIILGLLSIKVAELHSSLTQEQRLQSITSFKNLTVPVLICTDLASRGLDIPKIEVVINYDMPKSFEIYLHRVGRTARAGRQGKSISLVGGQAAERAIVKEAIKSASSSATKGKVVGRNIDWKEVEEINTTIESKESLVEEILQEEKQAKLLSQAERDIKKGENLIKYRDEIHSRPKRTWFEAEKDKKSESQLKKDAEKVKKRKIYEEEPRMYRKTQKDRMEDQKRTMQGQKVKKGGPPKKNEKKLAEKIKRAKKYKK